jgi:hypothetical protein
MSELDVALLKYVLTEQPPAALVKSLRQDFDITDSRVASVLDYLCDQIPDGSNMPGYLTVCNMLGSTDVLKETIAAEAIASNLNDYALLYHKRKAEKRMEEALTGLKAAIKRDDQAAILRYAEDVGNIGHEGRRRIGALDFDDFVDPSKLLRPGEYLKSHLPRLNQHLGGEPDDIDFEETGGLTLGEITIIAGSTNKGKSCLATSIWQHFIRESLGNPKYKSAYFNYEGALDRFQKTIFAHITGVFPRGDTKFYRSAMKEYEEFIKPRKDGFALYDAGGRYDIPYTVRALENELCKLGEEGYRAFFIDTINSLDDGGHKESWEIGEGAIRMLERVAARYNAAVICTAQNKQGLEFEDQRWPDLKWIASSAEMQRKPGVALGIYRTDQYSGGEVDYTEIALIKARHRSVYPREGIKVSYDRNRRMYVPYTGSATSVVDASEVMQKRQIVSTLGHTDKKVALAFGAV